MSQDAVVKCLSPDAIDQRFRERTQRSAALHARMAELMPRGVSGAAKHFEPYPIVITHTSGDRAVDVDGRTYVDLLMGAGPMLLGHGHPRVVEAISRQATAMTNPMMPNELSLEYAERLRGHMPYLERMRFANTGSEATRTAIRIARAATGRLLVAKAEGGYHGSDDFCLVSTHSRELKGSDSRPEPVLDYAGLSPRLLEEGILIPYNDPKAAAEIIAQHGHELAAVILEPVAFSSGGGIPATREFVRAVRDAASEHGALLIFDEVLCAFRMGLAGAPEYLGVTPDIATAGKAIGGGMPLALVGGREDVFDATLGPQAADRYIFQSGTFTENPLSMAAGMAALDVLEQEPILERADASAERIREGLRSVFDDAGVTAAVSGTRSIFQIHFGVDSVSNRRDVIRSDYEMTRAFLLAMVAEGVLWPPVHPAVTSGAHTDESADVVVDAAARVLSEYA